MKISELREIIREEILKEKRYIDPDEAGQAINYALDSLQLSLSKVKNPEKWAEKYHRGLPDVIEMIDRITKVLWKMR